MNRRSIKNSVKFPLWPQTSKVLQQIIALIRKESLMTKPIQTAMKCTRILCKTVFHEKLMEIFKTLFLILFFLLFLFKNHFRFPAIYLSSYQNLRYRYRLSHITITYVAVASYKYYVLVDGMKLNSFCHFNMAISKDLFTFYTLLVIYLPVLLNIGACVSHLARYLHTPSTIFIYFVLFIFYVLQK